jgi:hypothetical protein
MLAAMLDSEADCVRYRGADPDVTRRIVEAGLATQLDVPRPPQVHPLVRNRVTFNAEEPQLSAADVAGSFEAYLHRKAAEQSRRDEALQTHILALGGSRPNETRLTYRFTRLQIQRDEASFSYAWSEDFHTISVSKLKAADVAWLMRHSTPVAWSGISVSRQIHAWLTTSRKFANIRWYSEDQWKHGKDWQSTPI